VVWQYPSERMFFNAMKRKGWDAKEEDMSAIVAIHNGVNERAWYQVCRYEVRSTMRCVCMAPLVRWQCCRLHAYHPP